MSDDVKETCMKELGFQILDQDEKVTAIQLSNTWSIPLTEASTRLEEFAKQNEGDELQSEFLVRGVSRTGTVFISVVPEDKINMVEKKLETFSKSMFSVSKKRNSSSELYLNYKPETPQVINLQLDCGSRPVVVHVIPEARPAMEKKKSNIFAVPGNTKKPEETKKPEAIKKSPQKTPPKTGGSPVKSSVGSSVKKSAEKSVKGGKAPTAQLGKGSIASFFGQKPATSSAVKKTEKPKQSSDEEDKGEKMDVEQEETQPKKESPVKKVTAKVETAKSPKETKTKVQKEKENASRKRNLSSDRGSENETNKKAKTPPEEPSSKKAKKEVKTKKADKRSRIMTICDSDSSEDEVEKKVPTDDEDEDEAVTKKRGSANKKGKESPPVEIEQGKKKESPDENRNPEGQKKRRKAMRKVTKSYQDEDGFIRTVRETEEYSCSDEEPPAVQETTKPSTKGSKVDSDTKATSSTSTSSTLKAKVPQKQGSITSFFGKK